MLVTVPEPHGRAQPAPASLGGKDELTIGVLGRG